MATSARIRFFGQFLVDRGLITRTQLLETLDELRRTNLRFDEYAVQWGYLTAEQVQQVRVVQTREDLLFGEVAVREGMLSPEQAQEILVRQRNDHVSIGEALVSRGVLGSADRDGALQQFEQEEEELLARSIRLGDELPGRDAIECLVEMTEKMFLRVAGLRLKSRGLGPVSKPYRGLAVNSAIELSGDQRMFYVLSTDPVVAAEVFGALLDEPYESREDLNDGINEFANIISGNAMAKLAHLGLSFKIGPPSSLHEDDLFYERRWSRVAGCPLFSPGGEVKVDVFFP